MTMIAAPIDAGAVAEPAAATMRRSRGGQRQRALERHLAHAGEQLLGAPRPSRRR